MIFVSCNMDRIGKEKSFCIREKCCAPANKKPMRVFNITEICKYCSKRDNELNQDIKDFQIQESSKNRGAIFSPPKFPKPIRKKTTKQISIESAYKKIQVEILNERNLCCEGCGRSDVTITFSHRVSRKRRRDLVAVKENIDLMCMGCHEKVEVGLWSELLNGKEITDYIKQVEPELYWIYFHKRKAV